MYTFFACAFFDHALRVDPPSARQSEQGLASGDEIAISPIPLRGMVPIRR
jgi:hypothetical protein